MSDETLKNRLTELEVRVSFQQQTIEDLDDVVREFTLEVDAAGSNETVEEGVVE